MNHKKAIPFKITKSNDHGVLIQIDEADEFYNELHYHPEYQITTIIRGEGILYAGNNMTDFKEKDVFLIGSNVPHLFKCSESLSSNEHLHVKSISLFFDEFSFGRHFFELKEMKGLKELLKNSNRVIKISGTDKGLLSDQIHFTQNLVQEQIIISFLQILSEIRNSTSEFINTEKYDLLLNKDEGGRLNQVLEFIFQNYKQDIRIEQIAKIAFLSRSQFSYFFKLHTDKTFIQFLTELRIENACILLKNNKQTIEQICYETGFKNVSNFTRHFKKLKQSTPSNYRKLWNK